MPREQYCTITLLQLNKRNKTESVILFALACSLLPEDFHSGLIVSLQQLVLCHVAAEKKCSPYIIIVQIIFISLAFSNPTAYSQAV